MNAPATLAAGLATWLAALVWPDWTRRAWVALRLVGVLPPIGFSAGVPGHMMYQARYGYLVAPLAFAILAWTLCAAASFVW